MVGSFLDVLFFLLTVILSELHEKPRRKEEGKIELRKKQYRRICMRGITFLTAGPLFYVIHCCFLSSPFPFPLDVPAEWPLKRYII